MEHRTPEEWQIWCFTTPLAAIFTDVNATRPVGRIGIG
jgi:hypothetical protein